MVVYYTRPTPVNQNEVESANIGNSAMALFSGLSFLCGAVCSAFSGFSGMWISVRANLRTAAAARRCYNDALTIAFKGGFFGAMINIALAIFGISLLFLIMYLYLFMKLGSEENVY